MLSSSSQLGHCVFLLHHFVTSLFMCATWLGEPYDKCCVSLCTWLPSPPGLSALQGHFSLDSMDEQHSEKLCSSSKPPSHSSKLCLQGSALRGHIEFRKRGCKKATSTASTIIGQSIDLCVYSVAKLCVNSGEELLTVKAFTLRHLNGHFEM